MWNKDKYVFNPFKGAKNSGFKFSAPIPFDFKLIDELIEINSLYHKSKLVTLYGALPDNANPLTGLTAKGRGTNPNINNFEDFAKFVIYAKKRNFNFVYLLNSPRPFFKEEFENYKTTFEELLHKLKDIGVYNIKVGNQQLLEVMRDKEEFNIQTSTSLGHTDIRQIKNFLDVYQRVKIVNLATDTNKNIPLLKNLKKKFNNIEFELLIDEGCLQSCPARVAHISCNDFRYPCYEIQNIPNKWSGFFHTNIIYPWNLDFYFNLGYKNFKLTGYHYGPRANFRAVTYVRNYFKAIEYGINDFYIGTLLTTIGPTDRDFINNKMLITKEMIACFPNINHFIKNGDKCNTICQVTCDYCDKCANKLQKIIDI